MVMFLLTLTQNIGERNESVSVRTDDQVQVERSSLLLLQHRPRPEKKEKLIPALGELKINKYAFRFYNIEFKEGSLVWKGLTNISHSFSY